MKFDLPTELEKRVNESVERGEFTNQEEFFRQAAELLLDFCHTGSRPIPVDEQWEEQIEALLEEAQASGEASTMTDSDWDAVERQGVAVIQARKRA